MTTTITTPINNNNNNKMRTSCSWHWESCFVSNAFDRVQNKQVLPEDCHATATVIVLRVGDYPLQVDEDWRTMAAGLRSREKLAVLPLLLKANNSNNTNNNASNKNNN
jgi:hypothetical protein